MFPKIKSLFPPKFVGILQRLAFQLKGRPKVKYDTIDPVKKFPNKEKGGLIVSADFEMAWAWRFTKSGADYLQKGQIERENFPRIIRVFEKYGIPITFATVGHLFLRGCKKGDHGWMSEIPHFNDHWEFTTGGWYDHDPYSNFNDAPEWYAPDLIQMILDSAVEHEIGTHTFSHIDFSDKNCPQSVAEDELKACLQVAKLYNIDMKSIVFPGGTLGNFQTLKKYGIEIYRKSNPFELAYPYRDNLGLLITTSSAQMEYDTTNGWKPEYFVKRLIKYVNKAVATNTIAHLWFHPSLHPFLISDVFPALFAHADKLRDKGDLWIGSMKQIADHINKNRVL